MSKSNSVINQYINNKQQKKIIIKLKTNDYLKPMLIDKIPYSQNGNEVIKIINVNDFIIKKKNSVDIVMPYRYIDDYNMITQGQVKFSIPDFLSSNYVNIVVAWCWGKWFEYVAPISKDKKICLYSTNKLSNMSLTKHEYVIESKKEIPNLLWLKSDFSVLNLSTTLWIAIIVTFITLFILLKKKKINI